MTVWQLESQDQVWASDMVNMIYDVARTNKKGSVFCRNILKRLWDGNSWKTIKERMETEGSVWYVWYMDGVSRYLQLAREIMEKENE